MTANRRYVRDIDLETLFALYDQRPVSPSGYYFDATGNWSIPTVAPGSLTLTNSHILVGNASNVAADVAMSGDATIANTGALTLSNSGVSAATYGSATQVSQVTFDAKGRATSAANVSIQIAESQVTNLVTDLGNKQPLDATLTALAAYNTNGLLTQTAADTFIGRTITGTSNKIDVSNGDGVSGNPTLTISPTYVGQTSITTLGTVGTGTWQGTKVAEGFGGTNQSTYTTGDLLYASAANTLSKLGIGSGTQVLGISGGVPAWITNTATNIGTANEATDTTCFPVFVTASGTQTLPAKTNTTLKFNSNTGALGAPLFVANTVTPEATVLDLRDSSAASTTYGYTAFAWFAGQSSSSIDFEHTNSSTAAGATVDHTFFNSDQTKYSGIGQASVNYNVAGSTSVSASDAYWYSQTASLEIIAYAASQHIDLVTGGGNTANIRARASDSGFHIYGATTYMPLVGPTASNGAVQSVATGSIDQVLTYVSSSAKPTWQDPPVKMASFRSIDNATSVTPGTVDGTLPYTYYDVALGATTQGNVIITGSSADWVANSSTKFEWKYVGTHAAFAQITLITWSDGSATSPYYFLGAHLNGTYTGDQFGMLSNNGYYNPQTVGWAGNVVTNDVIAFKVAQTNGSVKAITFKNSICHIISTRINT